MARHPDCVRPAPRHLILAAGTDPTECRALMACGHYTEPVHAASTVFDFPEEGTRCPTCKEVIALHPALVQALS